MSGIQGYSAATNGAALSADSAANLATTTSHPSEVALKKDGNEGGSAVVTFFTQSYALHMPEQAYSVPLTVLPDGLSSLVQTVLGVPDSEKFDFLLNDEYMSTSLQRFLHRRGISYEDILHLEYTPTLQAKEGIFVPQDDWPSSVRAPYLGCADVLLTGSYDHCVRLLQGNSCLAMGAFHTACVKEVCVHPSLTPLAESSGVTHRQAEVYKRHRTTSSSSSSADVATVLSANDAEGDFYFVSCSKDGCIAGWRVLRSGHGSSSRSSSPARHPDVSGRSRSNRIQLVGSIHAHADAIDSVHMAPVALDSSRSFIVSAHHSADGEPRDAASSDCVIATASWDSTVKLFRWSQLVNGVDTLPSRHAPLLTFTDHTRPVLCCRFSAALGAERLYSAGLDGTVKVLDVSVGQMQGSLAGDHAINGLAVRPVGSHTVPCSSAASSAVLGTADLLLTANTDNRARFYDSRQKGVIKTFTGHRQWLYAATWLWRSDEVDGSHHTHSSPAGVLFATASEDATVRVYDLRCTSSALLVMDALHTDGVLDVTYAGQSMVACCGKDNKVKSFSLAREANTS